MAATADVVLVDGLRNREYREWSLEPIRSASQSPRTSIDLVAAEAQRHDSQSPTASTASASHGNASSGHSAVKMLSPAAAGKMEKVAVSLRRELSLLRHAFKEFEVMCQEQRQKDASCPVFIIKSSLRLILSISSALTWCRCAPTGRREGRAKGVRPARGDARSNRLARGTPSTHGIRRVLVRISQ
jgi:hypothetical protein